MNNDRNLHLKQALDLAHELLILADKGDLVRQDIGCGILFGVLRDSAYKIRSMAEDELNVHNRQKQENS